MGKRWTKQAEAQLGEGQVKLEVMVEAKVEDEVVVKVGFKLMCQLTFCLYFLAFVNIG